MLQYIDTHIKEKLNIEKLAGRAGFSPYHFCRVFQWNVGYSIMEYVRKRKLAFAAFDLNSGHKITNIANDYGFETHSGFTKAFRRHFGCTPEKYRTHSSFDAPKLPILKKSKQYFDGGIVLEPKMTIIKPVKLAGFAKKININDSKEISTFWRSYLSDGRCEKLHSEPFLKNQAEYGACFPVDPENGEFEYVIGIEVNDGHQVPNEYHVCIIPEALYAVFTTPPSDNTTFLAALQGTWSYIFSEWFPNSGYEFAEGIVNFEIYDERCMGETGKIEDIYIPVVKKIENKYHEK